MLKASRFVRFVVDVELTVRTANLAFMMGSLKHRLSDSLPMIGLQVFVIRHIAQSFYSGIVAGLGFPSLFVF